MQIVDDRVISHAALDAVRRSSRPAVHRIGRIADTAEAFALASLDLSRSGIALTIEAGRALREDILCFATDVKLMGRSGGVPAVAAEALPADDRRTHIRLASA